MTDKIKNSYKNNEEIKFNNLFKANEYENIFYNEAPLDKFLHSKGVLLCGVLKEKINYLDKQIDAYVIVCDSFFLKLPSSVREVFMFHEIGHIMNGDLENLNPEIYASIMKQRLQGKLPEMEINADKYAVSKVGIDKVKEAFMYIINNTKFPKGTKLELIQRCQMLGCWHSAIQCCI